MEFPGIEELLKKYQAKAPAAGIDPLGYYMAPWAYADLQVLGQAIEATKSLDDEKLADYMRGQRSRRWSATSNSVRTANGRRSDARGPVPEHHGNSVDDFRDTKTEVIVYPPQFKSGDVIYPYENRLIK